MLWLVVHDVVCFPEYEGGCDYDNAMKYLTEKLVKIARLPENSRKLYSHVTCATDTENIRVVLEACSDIILQKALDTAFV